MVDTTRYWLLTWTTYGIWLPGDERGCVTRVRQDARQPRFEHDIPGEPYDVDMPGLRQAARAAMRQAPMYLAAEHAVPLKEQFLETATYRGWTVRAMAMMPNHIHLVVEAPGDPEPDFLLHSFKSYATRRLNRDFGKKLWWTSSGSKRRLPHRNSVEAAIEYVRRQPGALLIWINDRWSGL